MKSRVALAAVAVVLAAGCSKQGSGSGALVAPRCTAFGGFAEQICPASLSAVIALPERFNGRVIVIQAPVEQIEGRTYAFASVEQARTRQLQDAVECTSTPAAECASKAGSTVTLFGHFKKSAAPTDTLFQPAGTIELLKVRGARPTGSGSAR